MSNQFRVRKNITSLIPSELKDLRKAFRMLMQLRRDDHRSFAHHAGIHGLPDNKCLHDPKNMDMWPKVHLFLPWHRAYLYFLEKDLQEQVPGVTIPYWDWKIDPEEKEEIPEAFLQEVVDGEPNPLYKFKITIPSFGVDFDTFRDIGQSEDAPHLPDALFVKERVMERFVHFEQFSEALRLTVHNPVHLWVGGTMADQRFAAYDPIFWSHHCMVDKLWWDWQNMFGVENIPSYYKDMALAPFENATVKQVLDIYTLGYDYTEDSTDIVGEWR